VLLPSGIKINKFNGGKFMKKVLVILLSFAMIFSLVSCSTASKKTLIGVAMPTQSLQRWNQDGSNMKSELEAKGYQVELQYANNDINTQVQQIENMITKGCKVIVIAAVDGSALTDALKTAKDSKVKIIAYDRLIMKSPNVDYYATFDNFKVGAIQGQFIETKLDLKNAAGPFNIEIFAGDPADNNATFFYKGAMSILQPYIDKGKLVVKSGQTTFNATAIASWDSSKAQGRMDNLITSNYAGTTKLDAILSPNDSLAIGIVASLKNASYGTPAKAYPILTGQDCDKPNVKAIIAGQQSMSIFKDTRKLATKVVEMVGALISGKSAAVNDTKTYDNGTKIVPSYLLAPMYVDKSNYQATLIDSGYYKATDIQ
jgi:putative multiple sugar transport system substrate-binding protein